MKINEEYSLPQKIHFELKGGIQDKYPLDLRDTAEFLIYFQHIIDKSYAVISGKERLSAKDREDYQVRVNSLQVGSLISDLILIIKGVSLALPLAGFTNPKTVWDYTCYALEFCKRCSKAKKENIPAAINIESHGDNSPITLNVNIGNESFSYPPETLEIARRSLPAYRKLAAAMDRGKFTSFLANNDNNSSNFDIDFNETKLFSNSNVIQDDTKNFESNIIDFNKETMTGKLRILAGDLKGNDFPFAVIGNQNPSKYISSMDNDNVTIYALTEISRNNLESKISKIHIIDVKS